MSREPDRTTSADRALACVVFAARARSRAQQMVATAEAFKNRAVVARRFTEQATARVTGAPDRKPAPSSGR